MKTICIDYDGPYTEMPEFFDAIIEKAKALGYTVLLVTMRYPHEADDSFNSVASRVSQVIFTSRKAKMPFLMSLGIQPHLWIDDNPMWILFNAGK